MSVSSAPLFAGAGGADPLRRKALAVHERLCAEYGAPFDFFHDHDPLSELVSALLSHRTKNKDSGKAFDRLRERFGIEDAADWQRVAEASTEAVADAIAPATWPEQKAPRIQEALRRVHAERGDGSLDFLAGWPPEEARAWLQRIPGVGPKTSAAVLVFSNLRMPALPVDSHHHRVARRLGLVGEGVGPGPAHARLRALLPADWSAQQLYDHHEALMYHGQRRCYHRAPECDGCPVLDLCPAGQARVE